MSEVEKAKMSDNHVAQRERVEYTFALVEINLNKPLVEEVVFEDAHGVYMHQLYGL